MITYENYSLQTLHTFHLPIKTRYYVEYASVDELRTFLAESPLVKEYPLFHMGGGSNLLFLHDYEGVVLHSGIRFIETLSDDDDTVLLRVGAAVEWDTLVEYCVKKSWGGIENLSLIPGEVGASAVQNIGAYGVEAKDVIEQVETVEIQSGAIRIFSTAECRYAYRDSIFKNELKGKYIVTAVQYRLQKNPEYHLEYGHLRETIGDRPLSLSLVRQVVMDIRHSKLPDCNACGNAGSFFKNPIVPVALYEKLKKRYPDMPAYPVDAERVKLPAGWLIDRAGWRGRTHRGAGVCDTQALVLINKGDAAPQDIVELSYMICRSVKEQYGVELTPEVNIID